MSKRYRTILLLVALSMLAIARFSDASEPRNSLMARYEFQGYCQPNAEPLVFAAKRA